MNRIVVIGSSNTDMVVKTSRFPRPGETIIGGEFFLFPGGKGANQAVAAARLGGRIALICSVGEDLFGHQAIEGFDREGIDTAWIWPCPQTASGVALITVNASGENSIVVAPGANLDLAPGMIDQAQQLIAEADCILIQLEIPLETVAHAIETSRRLKRKIILNPAPAKELPMELLDGLFLITPNETEAEILTGIKVTEEKSAGRAADVLLNAGIKNVIVTLGSKGAYYKSCNESFLTGAPVVVPVDTTAAGDVFNGAMAVALSESMGWNDAVSFACKAASLSITRMGAQSSAPFRNEL